jgi:DNA repair ATPase RecN
MGFGLPLGYLRRAVGGIASIHADLRTIAQAAAALPRIEEQLKLLTEAIAVLPALEERLAAIEQTQRSLAAMTGEFEASVTAIQRLLGDMQTRLDAAVSSAAAPVQDAAARTGGFMGRFGRSRPAY